MAGEKKKKASPDEESAGVRCAKGARTTLFKAWRTLLRPSIHVFFLWSSIMFVICGLLTVVGNSRSTAFFCKVRPQREFGGMGCENTTVERGSSILSCPKPSCWRNAYNITYMENALKASGDLYAKFIDATTDVECNEVIGSEPIMDPVAAITKMSKMVSTAKAVTQSCIDYNCGVLMTALNNTDLSSPTGKCTNEGGSKPDEEADTCICNGILTLDQWDAGDLAKPTDKGKSEEMQAVGQMCGQPVLVYMYRLCSSYKDISYPTWCVTTTTTTTTSTITTSTSTTSTSTTVTTSSTTSSTTTRTVTQTARRLQSPLDSSGLVVSVAPAGVGGDTGAALPAGGLSPVIADHRGADASAVRWLSEDVRALQDAPAAAPAADAPAAAAPAADAPAAAATSGTIANTELQEYTVRDWSPCTCYIQCSPGVRTRIVECLTDKCKAPKPPTRDACWCGHVAMCTIDMRLIILLGVSFLQALIGFVVFVLYFKTLSHSGEDYVQLGYKQKCCGCFYKQLPPLLRILVLIQMFQAIWLAMDVWIMHHLDPLGYQSACYASTDLQLVSIVVSSLWVAQVTLGRFTKRYARKPDWLFSPERPSKVFPLKQFRMCFRCLGP